MHSLYSLTPRQQRFCEYYAVDPCGERAAISAGYQPKSARQQSARLLTYDNVQAYLRQLQMHITRFEHIFIRDEADRQYSTQDHQAIIDAIAAGDKARAETLAEANWLGVYEEQRPILEREIRGKGPV